MTLTKIILITATALITGCGKMDLSVITRKFPIVAFVPITFASGATISGGGSAQVTTALGNKATVSFSAPTNQISVLSARGGHATLNAMSQIYAQE